MTNIELETLTMLKAACREFINSQDQRATPDWEQRRYEIARDCMASQMANINHGKYDFNECAANAVRYADTLIAELKKSNN